MMSAFDFIVLILLLIDALKLEFLLRNCPLKFLIFSKSNFIDNKQIIRMIIWFMRIIFFYFLKIGSHTKLSTEKHFFTSFFSCHLQHFGNGELILLSFIQTITLFQRTRQVSGVFNSFKLFD